MGKLAEALLEHRSLLEKLNRVKFTKEKYRLKEELDINWKKLKDAFFSPEDDDEEDKRAVKWIMDNPTE